jgi:hypothetical protein
LIYLEAGYEYAFYDPAIGNMDIDSQELQKKIERLKAANTAHDERQLIQELLQENLPQFERELRDRQNDLDAPWPDEPQPTAADQANFQAWASRQKRLFGLNTPEAELRQHREATADGHVGKSREKAEIEQAIIAGQQKYTAIPVPVLAFFAVPQDYGPYISDNPAVRDAIDAVDMPWNEARAAAFEAGLPSAHVVRLKRANHYVFMSNEAEVLREMRAFLAGLH